MTSPHSSGGRATAGLGRPQQPALVPQPSLQLTKHLVLFVTPEQNRSVPGALKDAIDIASMPSGLNAFDGKAGGIVSVSPGALGGFGANHRLRQALVALNVAVMPQPEAYIGRIDQRLDADGRIADGLLETWLRAFVAASESGRQGSPGFLIAWTSALPCEPGGGALSSAMGKVSAPRQEGRLRWLRSSDEGGSMVVGEHVARDASLLAGRTVLVEGGTGNVGRVIVDALVECGAGVVVPSRSAARSSGESGG